jgi:hypothetical protein
MQQCMAGWLLHRADTSLVNLHLKRRHIGVPSRIYLIFPAKKKKRIYLICRTGYSAPSLTAPSNRSTTAGSLDLQLMLQQSFPASHEETKNFKWSASEPEKDFMGSNRCHAYDFHAPCNARILVVLLSRVWATHIELFMVRFLRWL